MDCVVNASPGLLHVHVIMYKDSKYMYFFTDNVCRFFVPHLNKVEEGDIELPFACHFVCPV